MTQPMNTTINRELLHKTLCEDIVLRDVTKRIMEVLQKDIPIGYIKDDSSFQMVEPIRSEETTIMLDNLKKVWLERFDQIQNYYER